MSKTTSVFQKVPVKVQDRSGFDMSHENLFTAKVGTLIPASVEEVMPGDVVSVGGALSVELPPLATNFKGRVDARLEAFFVPNRLIWGGWQEFITQDKLHPTTGAPGFTVVENVPRVIPTSGATTAGTLCDYLGAKSPGSQSVSLNALPFLAYHKIWDDWYRDSKVQKPFFLDGIRYTQGSSASADIYAAGAPYLHNGGTMNTSNSSNLVAPGNRLGWNGINLTSLYQRNFAKDYFTTMTSQPQAGAASSLEFTVDTTASTGSFSIASLRAANALQKWLERNNIAGTRYYDQILAHYGVLPSDAVFQRAVLLGAMTTPVIVNSVAQQAQGTNSQTKNPYANSTGAMFGRGNAFGKDSLIDNFEVKEHGFIVIMFSLVPHAYYSTGARRYLTKRSKSGTYAFPEFAGIGDQEVYLSEMWSPALSAAEDATVGYAQRYSEYKYHEDEVHGLLRDGENLSSFVLQRGFNDSATVSSDLLRIPTNFMDSVMVTTEGVSGFNAIVDCFFDAKYLRPLPEYSLPTLCESEGEGKKVYVDKGGKRL